MARFIRRVKNILKEGLKGIWVHRAMGLASVISTFATLARARAAPAGAARAPRPGGDAVGGVAEEGVEGADRRHGGRHPRLRRRPDRPRRRQGHRNR